MSRKSIYLLVVIAALVWAGSLPAAEPGKGKILFECWFDIGNGTAVTDLTGNANYPNNPSTAEWLSSFLFPAGVTGGGGLRDNYGVRGQAYVVPPQTGDYTFWVAGDDMCELWLSTDENPGNATMIANITGWTPAQDWTNTAGGSTDSDAMKSDPIKLTAGKKYYIMGLMKEAGGGDSLGVAWAGPGIGTSPTLLDGKYCYAFLRSPEPLMMARNPNPADGTIGVQAPLVTWTAGVTAMFHDVYFGTDPNPPLVSDNVMFNMYYHVLGTTPGTRYYWKVDEIEADGVTTHEGPVWSFVMQAVTAYYPQPASGDQAVSPVGPVLTWMPGLAAVKHHVYFGTDADAVTQGAADVDKGEKADPNFAPGALEPATTYYWRVDEIDTVGTVQTGEVWSFSTCVMVDDFESYTDEEPTRIFDAWLDGWASGDNGSTVGNLNPPFAERTVIHGGLQSMPMDYNNINSPYYSEAELTLPEVQNWTADDVNTLSLWFRGAIAPAAPVVETDGKFTVSAEGADIWGTADQFTFVYKTLNGDGTLVARVVSNGTGSNRWAKGGVMIRDGLDAGSTHASMDMTGGDGNGRSFQYRATADLDSASNDGAVPALAPPYWVKIERKGDTLSGYVSANGTTWTQEGGSQFISMMAPAHIGLCVTSHAAGQYRTFEFDNVKATGSVSGDWQTKEIGLARNSTEPLYFVVEDSAGKSKVITNPDPAAVNVTQWTEWKIPLADITGVNLSKVEKVYIGVGDRDNSVAGGTGKLFIDDIRVLK